MYIFAMCDKIHGVRIHGSRETSTGNISASSFIYKNVISPTNRKNLKYDASQEIRPSPTIPGDVIQHEIPKLSTCEQRSDWIRHRIEITFNRKIFFCGSGNEGMMEKNLVICQPGQTRGTSQGTQST